MGDFSLNDTVGQLLSIYQQREQAKIDARLLASREQIAAYELASMSAGQNAAAANSMPAWVLPVVGFGLLAAVVWKVAQ